MQLDKRNNNQTRTLRSFHTGYACSCSFCFWALTLGQCAHGTDLDSPSLIPTFLQTWTLRHQPLGLTQPLLDDGGSSPQHCTLVRLLVWDLLAKFSRSVWASTFCTRSLSNCCAQLGLRATPNPRKSPPPPPFHHCIPHPRGSRTWKRQVNIYWMNEWNFMSHVRGFYGNNKEEESHLTHDDSGTRKWNVRSSGTSYSKLC